MRRRLLLAVVGVFLLGITTHAQGGPAGLTDAERDAIKRPALDYAEGYYEGDAAKMERALHPDLAKRIPRTDPQGRARLDHMGALQLVQIVRAGAGKQTPPERQLKDVVILDVFQKKIASLRVEMDGWVDYLHVAKMGERWVIVNVLWDLKPRPPQ